MRRFTIALCLFLIALTAVSAHATTVTSVGEGSEVVKADTATLTVGVTSSNENATLAAQENAERMTRTVEALKAAGVKEEDILPGYSSSSMSGQSYTRVCTLVNNTTVCQEERYNATSLAAKFVIITLDAGDEAMINRVLDTARAQGADAEVTGYSLSDPTQARTQARQKAVENARANARDYAAALGLRLGEVVETSDVVPLGPFGLDPFLSDFRTDPFSGSVVEEGMVEVTAVVMVTFEASSG